MTIKQILQKYYSQKLALEQTEIDLLLALALHKKIEYLYKNPEKELAISTKKAFQKLIRLRLANWPIAYLQKKKDFFNLKFLVNQNTLIPRPESEMLIEEALKFLKNKNNLNILDLGTGSGALIITLAKNNQQQNYFATDISKKALKVAKTNARKHKVKINFTHSNLLNKVPQIKFDFIIANLPYLTTAQMKEPSIKKEPRLALLSGQNGLDHYRALLKNLKKHLSKHYLILLEIDPEQSAEIKKIISQYLSKAKIEIQKDLNSLDRLVKISPK
ncbi:peptide chain release factor N(5)-glutamine methyltransferase [Candidatus Nomurabacteria bacterium]|nr:peptide chain release factor N(5)-glutamine methyltransferase [Candidatus Nomurabacteria bacterium]